VKVFISYSRLDSDLGKAVYTYLSDNHEVFIDTKKIAGGEEWESIIENEISKCDRFILILTLSSINRDEVKKEIDLAINKKKKIIPCIHNNIEDKDIPWELKKYNGIHFAEGPDLGRKLLSMIHVEEKSLLTNVSEEKQNVQKTTINSPQEYLEKAKDFERPKQNQLKIQRFSYIINEIKSSYANKEYNKVINLCDKAIEEDYDNPKAHLYKGNAFKELKRYKEASKCYDKTLAIEPDNMETLEAKYMCLLEISKREYKNKLMTSKNKEWTLNNEEWQNLLNSINQKLCIPVIGPNVLEFFSQIEESSITKGELAMELAYKYDYPLEAPYQLPKVLQFLALQRGECFLKITISKTLAGIKAPDFRLEKYNKLPYVVLARLNLPIYITTNYDLFLEEALKSQGKEPISDFCRWNDQLIELAELETNPYQFLKSKYIPTPEKPLVFHFFGSIDNPQSLVLTEKDFYSFVINLNKERTKHYIPLYLRKALLTSLLLFIGYNVDDIDFRSVQEVLHFMSSINRRGKSIVVIEFPVKNISEKDENAMENFIQYAKHYTSYMFDMISYLGDPYDFVEQLQTRLDKFKEKKHFE
jgi:tetratricopeptide (TPR) repeat protein